MTGKGNNGKHRTFMGIPIPFLSSPQSSVTSSPVDSWAAAVASGNASSISPTGIPLQESSSHSRSGFSSLFDRAKRKVPGSIKQVRGATYPPPSSSFLSATHPATTASESPKTPSAHIVGCGDMSCNHVSCEKSKSNDRTGSRSYIRSESDDKSVDEWDGSHADAVGDPFSVNSSIHHVTSGIANDLSISNSKDGGRPSPSRNSRPHDDRNYSNTNVSNHNSNFHISPSSSGDSSRIPSGSDGSQLPLMGLCDFLLPPSSFTPKAKKFQALLQQPNVDLVELRRLSWSGVPAAFRPMVWQLLLGYLPANSERRASTLERKRKEYLDCVPQYFSIAENERTEYEQTIYRQIVVDVPRTSPETPLFHTEPVQRCLERILYIWAIRHPGSGYVQGINDLLTPFFLVFLSAYVQPDQAYVDAAGGDWAIAATSYVQSFNPTSLQYGILNVVEADSFWCLSKLLDGIQDHYTFAQPGIQKMVYKLKELVRRVEPPLYDHLENQNLQFLQFSFRWMNCLLMRELSLVQIIRVWDTYLAEDDGFAVFHVYVCAAFIKCFAKQLINMDFHDLVVMLQHLPTKDWGHSELDTLLSQAFTYRAMFENAQSHLQRS